MEKPYSQACENNKLPILAVLRQAFREARQVLEVGSGTGQHAVYFAGEMPHLSWQCSDLRANHAGINAWLADYPGSNLLPPVELDVAGTWPTQLFDAVYTANTLHIMSWPHVQSFFQNLGAVLASGAVLAVYGPFNYQGQFTSASNAQFNEWLKEADPARGIRDFEAVNQLAENAGLQLLADHAMPANNRLLLWQLV
ncbi:DUF938 domain-containing protein [Halioxenophilus aromaticivorans]|uniref:Class I SAM-dependent methyltransferase n=1 Tax=Halioxenophilus aromaticivorans TaxID=1306992 RepID=A0AAV3TX16_9ALTE